MEVNAKGYIQPSIHVFDEVNADACDQALTALDYLVEELRKRKYKLATDIKDVVKEKD